MRQTYLFVTLVAVASPVLAAPGDIKVWPNPGIDLSVNHVCPGVPGASSNGGALDCVALASQGKYISVYGTFIPAEAISDLSALDGELDVYFAGDVNAEGAFWNSDCVAQHGEELMFRGFKPTNGDPCGSDQDIMEIFTTGSSPVQPIVADAHHVSYFFNVWTDSPRAVTPPQRVFGFELRFDPKMATENGGACGSCCQPPWQGCEFRFECPRAIGFRWHYGKPGSQSGAQTTTLQTGTGYAGVDYEATFGSPGYCSAVPNVSTTWGRLKSLYR